VKGEVSDCDVVAVRGDEEPVVVELKTAFTLQLVFQGIRRQIITDDVYVAFGNGGTALWNRQYRDIVKLCRMLGLGLIAVSIVVCRGPYLLPCTRHLCWASWSTGLSWSSNGQPLRSFISERCRRYDRAKRHADTASPALRFIAPSSGWRRSPRQFGSGGSVGGGLSGGRIGGTPGIGSGGGSVGGLGTWDSSMTLQ